MSVADGMVLVTGSGSGIGRAIAGQFARDGAAAMVNARTASDVENAVSEIAAGGGTAVGLPADVSDPGQVEAMFCQARRAPGPVPVEILVNNAGIPGPAAVAQDVAPDEFLTMLKINLWCTFLCSKFALPTMIERGWGRIMTMTGASAARPYRRSLPYASSKAGIEGLTRNLAEKLARFGITYNCIAPGRVDTRAFALAVNPAGTKAAAVSPDLAASLAVWLASDEMSLVNGETIRAPGWKRRTGSRPGPGRGAGPA